MPTSTPTDPTDDPRWDRLIHLVAGELTPDEAAALRRWVEADPSRRAALAQLEAIWQVTNVSDEAETDAAAGERELRRIKAEAGGGEARIIARVGPQFDRLTRRRSRVSTGLRVAAMLVLTAGGTALWRRYSPAPAAAPAPVAMAEYRTAPGERLSLRLPDGTRVMLAPGGVLRRPSTYGTHERSVELDGEGYFEVTHDPTRPFAVHTARAVARDLGTRFVVRAYPDEPTTDVVVASGRVAVGHAAVGGVAATSDSLVLAPRERATVTTGGQLVFARNVPLDRYLAWTEGRLVFERTPLREVVRQLERWYGVEIRVADPALGQRRLTATLQEEGAAQAIDLVVTSLALSVSRSGNTYILSAARP